MYISIQPQRIIFGDTIPTLYSHTFFLDSFPSPKPFPLELPLLCCNEIKYGGSCGVPDKTYIPGLVYLRQFTRILVRGTIYK